MVGGGDGLAHAASGAPMPIGSRAADAERPGLRTGRRHPLPRAPPTVAPWGGQAWPRRAEAAVWAAPVTYSGCTVRVGQKTARKIIHKTLHRPCAPAVPHAKSLRKYESGRPTARRLLELHRTHLGRLPAARARPPIFQRRRRPQGSVRPPRPRPPAPSSSSPREGEGADARDLGEPGGLVDRRFGHPEALDRRLLRLQRRDLA